MPRDVLGDSGGGGSSIDLSDLDQLLEWRGGFKLGPDDLFDLDDQVGGGFQVTAPGDFNVTGGGVGSIVDNGWASYAFLKPEGSIELRGDGKVSFLPSGSGAADTFLQRISAGYLTLTRSGAATAEFDVVGVGSGIWARDDDNWTHYAGFNMGAFWSESAANDEAYASAHPTATGVAFITRTRGLGDNFADPRFVIDASGKHSWGGGTAAADVSLGRDSGGSALRAYGGMFVNNDLVVRHGQAQEMGFGDMAGGEAAMYFGNAVDTFLFRKAANVLGTGNIVLNAGAYFQSSGQIVTGTGGVTNYSVPLSAVYEDGTFDSVGAPNNYFIKRWTTPAVGGGEVFKVGGDGKVVWGDGTVNGPGDTNLYRAAAGIVATDGDLRLTGGGKIGNENYDSLIDLSNSYTLDLGLGLVRIDGGNYNLKIGSNLNTAGADIHPFLIIGARRGGNYHSYAIYDGDTDDSDLHFKNYENGPDADVAIMKGDGDFRLPTAGKGIILTSPDGLTTKTVTIDNAGVLVVA